ncbi:unnamed protein product [Rotaria magnacalcarata]|uniref:Tyrosine specific protein phosphatases domain-containing protein n=4 Tax=Rotaria magnacalcarata TaxID=392030 RepID=A0A815NZX4_9BILA|nr:unnamed protein product [Rotaria magnacalcarata]CAF1675799.1 unnamed protein product [Rotaria magnacalcarata]CAF4014852.1 unnamed protein product [Rotaria magnacalcarata]
MHLIRSPTLTFALIFTIFSTVLMIATLTVIIHEHSKNYLQLLVVCPPLNCVFLFLFSVTWIERRFRLSYIPFLCLLILTISCLTLTIISSLFFSLSIILYLNFIYYCLLTILFLSIIITTIVVYSYGSLFIHRYRNMMTLEQQNSEISKDVEHLSIDKLLLKSTNNNDLILYMSKLPGRRIRHDIRNIEDDLNQIQVHTIITLNESKELSFMNMTHKNIYNMDIYSMHIKRANIQHIIYPIRDRFIPKSISDYIQFIYSIIINANRFNHNHILVHCMGGMGRTGMTVVCLELVHEYIMKTTDEQEEKETLIERFCHYPFLLENYCRVCQAILNVRKARRGTIHNPLQIMFVHEFYARLTSSTYMRQIKKNFELHERLLANDHHELH